MNRPVRSDPNRFYSQVFEELDNLDLSGRGFVRALFSKCTFRRLRGTHFVNCTMENCRVETDDPRDVTGVTITFDCKALEGLRLSDVPFEALLYDVALTAPTEERRQAVHALIDPHRLKLFKRIFPTLE